MRPILSTTKRLTRRVDACIFFNELDLLTIRLEELWDHVEHFVVIEADTTFSGQSKPFFIRDHQPRFRPYQDKLVYRTITDLPPILRDNEEARFSREAAQRNAITGAVSDLNLSANDIVIVSDVDEIPRANQLDSLDRLLTAYDYAIFMLTNHRGYINNISDAALNGVTIAGPVACRLSTLLREGAHQVRRGFGKSGGVKKNRSANYAYIDNGGWHFSSLGGPEAFWLKAANFSHIEDPYRVIRLGISIPEQQVFCAALDREQCRALQKQYLAHCASPAFSPLAFDTFEICQDVPCICSQGEGTIPGFVFLYGFGLRPSASAMLIGPASSSTSANSTISRARWRAISAGCSKSYAPTKYTISPPARRCEQGQSRARLGGQDDPRRARRNDGLH